MCVLDKIVENFFANCLHFVILFKRLETILTSYIFLVDLRDIFSVEMYDYQDRVDNLLFFNFIFCFFCTSEILFFIFWLNLVFYFFALEFVFLKLKLDNFCTTFPKDIRTYDRVKKDIKKTIYFKHNLTHNLQNIFFLF